MTGTQCCLELAHVQRGSKWSEVILHVCVQNLLSCQLYLCCVSSHGMVQECPGAAETVPQIEWLKQQKCVLSQFRGLVVQGQGISRVIPSEVQEGASVPGLSRSFWWLPAIFGVPWLVDTSFWSPPSSSCGLLSVRVCVLISFSYRNISLIELGPTLTSMTSSKLHLQYSYSQSQAIFWGTWS